MTRQFEVFLVEDAETDVLAIYRYIARNDPLESAEYIFTAIQDACLSLRNLPDRGHLPPELERLGIYDFQEIHFKPYRIIYQLRDKIIYVHCILDGRRSLQDLLQERLIR